MRGEGGENCLFKHCCPFVETVKGLLAELLKTLGCLCNGTDTIGMGLGKEFVGIAYYLLLDGLWTIVSFGHREIATSYLVNGYPSACMSLTDTGKIGIALTTEHLASVNAVKYVRVSAMTVYSRGISHANANVVKHCSIMDELSVGTQFRMPAHYLKSLVGNVSTML